MKTAILGGGLTGLTLGYLMTQQGQDFEILEREKECGGLMRTVRTEGFTFDYGGSHIIFSKNEKILKFMLELLKKNKVKNRRNTKVLYRGRYVNYPFENGLADLSKEENFECLDHFIQNLIKKEKGELRRPKNLREWCFYTFGEGIAEKYLIPYNSKIWKYPPEKIGLEWVERIPDPPVTDIIKSSLGIETEGYMHQLNFYYPKKGGIQALIGSLEQKMMDRVLKGFEVKKIDKEDDQWIVSNGNSKRLYDRIVSTIPIQALIKAVGAPRKVQDSASKLKHNSLISVMIGLEKSKVNNFSWLYIPDQKTLSHRVSFPSNFSPKAAPAGKSSAMAEVTCNIGSEVWMMKDEDIVDQIVSELHRMRVIDKVDVCFAGIKRSDYAYVINDVDYSKNLKIASDYFTCIGIDLVGRFAEFKYLNMDECIKSAMSYLRMG
jgi:protoporphyrinogen oxidase